MATLVPGAGEAGNTPPPSDETLETPIKPKDRKVVKAILNSLKRGSDISHACAAAGIGRVTLWRWRRKFPRLHSLIEAIQESAVDEVEDAMFKAAKEGNTTAGMFILTRRRAEKWPDRSLIVNNVINNMTKAAKNDDKDFTGSDAADHNRLVEYLRNTVK